MNPELFVKLTTSELTALYNVLTSSVSQVNRHMGYLLENGFRHGRTSQDDEFYRYSETFHEINDIRSDVTDVYWGYHPFS